MNGSFAVSRGTRVGIVVGLALTAAGMALAVPPVAQDPAYHAFADRRGFLGAPNFADLASNAGFLVVGALGLALEAGRRGRALFPEPAERLPYLAFFAALALTTAGSAGPCRDGRSTGAIVGWLSAVGRCRHSPMPMIRPGR